MIETYAYLNFGRWIVDCPKCGKVGATLAEPDLKIAQYSANKTFICPKCYPGMVAYSGKNANGSLKFNTSLQSLARKKAEKNNDVYKVVFPTNKKEIETVLSGRNLENKNWIPGETIEFLKKENKEHGVK
jgi:hypothetical protein